MKTQQVHRDNKQAGFTLVELMVVLVILTIGLLPLAIIQTRAQQDVFEAGQFSEAVNVAQLQIESAKALGFGNIQPDSGLVDGVYTWNMQVAPVAGFQGLEQITVSVGWDEKGRTRGITVFDRVSRR